MTSNEKYQEKVECRVECEPLAPSIITLVPDRWDTFYNGNPDFRLDLSNFKEEVKVTGFYRIHGNNYHNPQTLLMIASKKSGQLLHTMVIKGVHNITKSILVGYDNTDKDESIDGLKSNINGTEFYNSRCDNLGGTITCKPITLGGKEVPTQLHLCNTIPSANNGYTIINIENESHMINFTPITNSLSYSPYAHTNKKFVKATPEYSKESDTDSASYIKFYDASEEVAHTVKLAFTGDVYSLISNAENPDINFCTYFA